MHTGNPALIEFIRDAIRRDGPVTFAWFMEQALYHPEFGYYSSGQCRIGRRGDYFTNVSVGPLFGRLLAAQFAEMWELLGRPDEFSIVEQGAHHGDFARDALESARERMPDFFSALRYRIVEPFPILRKLQQETLRVFAGNVAWENSIADLAPFCGVHFSNELLDAMPVRLLRRSEGGWQELRVAEARNGFRFVLAPIADEKLRQWLDKMPGDSADPYETEINLPALEWIENVSRKLTRGYVLTVDYGHSRDEFFAPERAGGTLQGYAQHRKIPSPLCEVGRADITAHVEWTSLVERAEEGGLRLSGFADQHHFMTGLVRMLCDEFGPDAPPKSRGALRTLLHPELLGTTFQFLALSKNAADGPLSGFRFARDPRAALGLRAMN